MSAELLRFAVLGGLVLVAVVKVLLTFAWRACHGAEGTAPAVPSGASLSGAVPQLPGSQVA